MEQFFAVVAPGLEELLQSELAELGATDMSNTQGGVHFQADFPQAYRICLWSRLASRILFPLTRFQVSNFDDLYEGVRKIDWQEHLSVDGSFAVACTTRRSVLKHSKFAALRVKDAVVDWFRDRTGRRPNAAPGQPDLQLFLFLEGADATLYLDLSGESLHRRSYRLEGAAAPLKETLAAAILLRSEWPQLARAGAPLVDPMCGSGTLVIEAALMAGDVAPGLFRTYFGFCGWRQHQSELWRSLLEEARQRREQGLAGIPPLMGCDRDGAVLKAARENTQRAGLEQLLTLKQVAVRDLKNPFPGKSEGLLVVNPPYGERLGEVRDLGGLYRELGTCWKNEFAGWRAALLTGNPDLAFEVGYRALRKHAFFNGPIACRLLHFQIAPEHEQIPTGGKRSASSAALEHARMFANRLSKNQRQLQRWASQERISCYRLYDRDLPEYAMAVDRYGDLIHVQEYQAPASVAPEKAAERFAAALELLPEALGVPPENVFSKVRRRQKGKTQYQRQAAEGVFHEVEEGGLRFLVNLTDYLDTGLFLDHRPVRAWLRERARGKRFLNLFCYTGTATVHAAAGGARSTTSIDLSATYLEWAQRNLDLNGFRTREHRLVRADCLEWLRSEKERYDLIFVDPPTFSNSKRMTGVFDVQRDHVTLIRLALARLAPGGTLIFSTNQRRFRLDDEQLRDLQIREFGPASVPFDFSRQPRIHRCWILET